MSDDDLQSRSPNPTRRKFLLTSGIRPIEGREVIATIFAQSSSTRGSGTYTAEFKLDDYTTFLRWVGTMDGHKIESLEVIVDNEQGLIVERTIAMRPYPALKLFRDANMHHSRISCRPMLGTIQRHSVTRTGSTNHFRSVYSAEEIT